MSTFQPSSRIRTPFTGLETWLDERNTTCKTSFDEIKAKTGVHEDTVLKIMFLRGLPYEEYLRSSHWQEVRRDVHMAQKGVCALCPQPIRDVHHKVGTYIRKAFERDDDVIGLCRNCHTIEHDSLVAQLREEIRNQQQ